MAPFVPRQRKHKKILKTHRNQDPSNSLDSNIVELHSSTTSEKIARKNAIKNELMTEHSGMSSGKRKRLDKYIEKKLRKEENLDIIKKLSSAKSDTSLLQSSKKLGQGSKGNAVSSRVKMNGDLVTQSIPVPVNDDEDVESQKESQDDDFSVLDVSGNSYSECAEINDASDVRAAPSVEPAVGTGLKRPLEVDDSGRPIVKRRRRAVAIPLTRRSNAARMRVIEESDKWVGPYETSRATGDSYPDSESCFSESSILSTDLNDETKLHQSQIPNDSDEDSFSGLSSSDEQELNSESQSSDSEDTNDEQKPRSESFKSWILDSTEKTPEIPLKDQETHINVLANQRLKQSIQPPAQTPSIDEYNNDYNRKVFTVDIPRSSEMREWRLSLPVVMEEQKIMEAIHNNPIVVICGATGSGKTTQIPQFLYEAGYGSSDSSTPGMIGVTQPRRVAAVSSADRVGIEMSSLKDRVAYQIRFDSNISGKTAIKYMTDGILLREIAGDFALKKYSAIIIDEAHERTTNTDLLIGMLSRIVELRKHLTGHAPLKLIIMSATLRVSDFTSNTKLFRAGSPPIVEVEGRQYPVTTHFARSTQRDYLEETYTKICRGHKKLPQGGMLVFLTGQNEILAVASRLNETLSQRKALARGPRVRTSASEIPLEVEDLEIGHDEQVAGNSQLDDSDDISDNEDREFEVDGDSELVNDVLILPLYSQLPIEAQKRVFQSVPENTRLIVLATNVAETSLTIPGIRYVFDCGRAKARKHDVDTGVQSFEIGWISKASANQRAGRAGRTGPGHCYRLYSSAVYERDFKDNADPEILSSPVEGVVLQLKAMGMKDIINFPFPTSPGSENLKKAKRLLRNLSALTAEGKVTTLGHDLTTYPLSPRFAKILLLGHQAQCIYLTIATVAALGVQDLFVPESQLQSAAESGQVQHGRNPRRNFNLVDNSADMFTFLCAFSSYSWLIGKGGEEDFCDKMGLRRKALQEAYALWRQLLGVVSLNRQGLLDPGTQAVPVPDKKQTKALKQIVAAGFIDQIAIRADLAPNPPEIPRTPKRAIDVPYLTLFPSNVGRATTLEEKAVFIHPSSILAQGQDVATLPQYLVYSRLQQSASSTIEGAKAPRVRMHPLTPLTGKQILALARGSPLLEYGKPIGKPELVKGKDGVHDTRLCWMAASLIREKGSVGWPLPAQRFQQRLSKGGHWEVESIVD
ncbi:putative ATP-dependent RNA helicase DHR1 [Xylographa opegraphella]|nr:putative ATP-dependent RNA helicase DHR1 [Xylographa opegraphella]